MLLITLVAVLVSGCLNANVSLTIYENDRVSGQLMVAVPTPDGEEPLRLQPPQGMADRVRVSPYDNGDRSGSKLSFTKLTFDELEHLAASLSRADSRYRFDIERAGSLVTVQGSVDLTPLAETDSSVLIEINTPGEVTSTNGRTNAGMVSWYPPPGEVTQISATFQFTGTTQNVFWWSWTTLFSALTLATAVLVAVLALLNHRRMRNDTAESAP
ncbi:uncharacterized protein DUF3153 [Halopolyspora algeriensis]|uniref:Uncharacterized protein DUF3153 n=2 Tax=Halopolyspora algeriensis TaxID=1500506 RepID=A0A368VVB1_9ACTN|nr:uncharacterized protein DUF3153 [Halopolyspora algeriensis]